MEHAQIPLAENVSMATNFASEPIAINYYFGYAVQAVYTTGGTLAGTFALQASVNHQVDTLGNVIVQGDFVEIEDSDFTITGAGSYVWNVRSPNYSYFRLVYAADPSDTGTLNAFATIKGI